MIMDEIKNKLLKYSYYDDNGDLIAVVKKDVLKEIFNADIILWEEEDI